jgi:hypothetical protein
MIRRLAPLTILLALLAAGAPQPAGAAGSGCTAHLTKLRYRPQITWGCTAAVTGLQVTVRRAGNHHLAGSGTPVNTAADRLAFTVPGDLASGTAYTVTLSYQLGAGPPASTTASWRTLPPPAHPRLRVKYITAIPADAVLDLAHRMDAANLFAVPRGADFIDASTHALRAAQYTSALRGHQSALVVTDLPVLGRLGLDSALNLYCNQGHGVVLGGQTHWLAGNEGWTQASAVGAQTTRFASRWALYTYDDVFPNQVSHGKTQMAPGSVVHHFLTHGLRRFTVIGPSSGEPIIQDYSSGQMLARLQHSADPSSPFHMFGQVLLAARQIGSGRAVDLGFRPWSANVATSGLARGGFDPSVSAGGPLTARSLWWATNRIPPTGTRFTIRPGNPSDRATVVFALAAKDADPDGFRDLRFRYRVDRGRWHWAVGNSFVLYHLARGSVHTVYGRAVDSGGNIDPHTARYTFRVSAGALG